MPSTITADLGDHKLTVDLSAVTGWDAITYGLTTGQHIETALGIPAEAPLADLAVTVWLWHRQNGQPNVSLEAAARTITLLPADEPPTEAAPAGAPEAT